MRTFTVGDIHGGYKALLDVLTQANFDYENDKLIALGDVCDGWSETPEAIELLLKIKNLIYIKGNHDDWAVRFLSMNGINFSLRMEQSSWLHHGGQATKDAYIRLPELKNKHIEFMKNGLVYYIDEENRLFIHAGFSNDYIPGVHHKMGETNQKYLEDTFLWDREFWYFAHIGRNVAPMFKEVYIGHTPTLNYKKADGEYLKPMKRKNVYNMDTGACFTGTLSMMNIDTKELFQSDNVMKYYLNEKGRN